MINIKMFSEEILELETPEEIILWDKTIELSKDLGKSAVEKFGSDPAIFKDKISNFNNILFKAIREGLEKYPNYYCFRISSLISSGIELLLSWYNAILQINMEIPGFKDEFPEICMYIRKRNSNERFIFLERKVEKKVTNYYNGYNRFSGKHDMKTIKNLLKIEDKDLKKGKYEEYRVDDYIASHLPNLLKRTKSEKLRKYLLSNFTYQDSLIPEDYYEIILKTYAKGNIIEKEVLEKLVKQYNKDSIYWIDQYFKFQEELLKQVDYEKLPVQIVRKINSTRI